MGTFGRYEILDTLALGPTGAVYSARAAGGAPGGDGRFVVKVFTPPAPADPDEPSWETQYFLDRARAQRHVASSGGKHWAAVHDLGPTADGRGAYVVTDYQPLSAQTLIDGKVKVAPATLHHVASSVLRGLVELREIAGRAHGSLKPANVRFAGQGDPAALPVVLTDPAQAHLARKEGELGDLQALGRLIYELVTHRPFEGLAGPLNAPEESQNVVPPSPAWSDLGPQGDKWRELCADLLTRHVRGRPASPLRIAVVLEELKPKAPHAPRLPSISFPRVRLPRLRVPRPRLPRVGRPRASVVRRVAMATVVVALLLAAGAGVLAFLESSARNEFRRERAAWYGSFARAIADPARRERYAADPDLKAVVDRVTRPDVAAFDADGRPASPLARLDFRRPRAAAAALREAGEGLSPAAWKRLGAAVELRNRYERRGWAKPVEYLNALTRAAQPGAPGGDVAAGIDRFLDAAPRLEQESAAAEQTWERLDAAAKELETSRDPILRALGGHLRTASAQTVELSDAGFAGLAALGADADRAGQLVQVLQRGQRGEINLDRLSTDLLVAKAIDPARVKPLDAERWLSESARYAVRGDETARAANELRQRLNDVSDDVAPEQRGPFAQEQRKLLAAVGEFAKASFVAKDFEDGSFAAQRDRLDAAVAALGNRYHQTPTQWVDALPALATASPAVNAYWENWKKSARAAAERAGTDRGELQAVKLKANKLRGVLTHLESSIAAVPADLGEPFAAVARDKRERELLDLLGHVDPNSPNVDVIAAAQRSESLGAWMADLRDLGRDFPIRKELLTLSDRPDLTWRSFGVWDDPAVKGIVAPDVERIARLQSLLDLSRDELVKAANDSNQPEIVLAVWQMLTHPEYQPPWPTREGELAQARQLREKLAAMLTGLKNPAEGAVTLSHIRESGPRQWQMFASGISSEAMLKSALQLRGAFGAGSEADLAALPAGPRLNVWLYLARQAMAAGDDAAVRKAVENLRAAVAEMDERQRPAGLLERLARFDRKEPFADNFTHAELFTLAVPNLNPALYPRFRRVEPAGGRGRPFYLGTTEVTLEQYAAVIDATGAWGEVLALPWGVRPGPDQKDSRLGPRGWEWDVSANPPRMAATQAWMEDTNIARVLRAEETPFNRMSLGEQYGGNPSPRHPMQQIPAQAALHFASLLNCRLPTSDEWLAAFAAEARAAQGAAAGAGRNLRDRTWETQTQYAMAEGLPATKWPDQGAFVRPADAGGAVTASASRSANGRDNDGVLLFRPVDPAAGAVAFRDLVGNVAEFVCDAPEAFAARPDGRVPTDPRAFASQAADSVFVIGGSALSPRDVPVDRKLPVAKTDIGYADVGFRLAFTAPARSPAERLKWALGDQTYVWPAAAAAPKSEKREERKGS